MALPQPSVCTMATVWMTYAWDDNTTGDVDYVAQQLVSKGIEVKLDRWNIRAGERLWEQISKFIEDPAECDAWVFYATQGSLGSQPCREEYATALDRALNTRGTTFPIVAIFPGSVDKGLIPSGIRTRLYVSLKDSDWLERVVAAAEGRAPVIPSHKIAPFEASVYEAPAEVQGRYVVEIRPRAGVWNGVQLRLRLTEKEAAEPKIAVAPKGALPRGLVTTVNRMEGISDLDDDGVRWWWITLGMEVTPTMSLFLVCQRMPRVIAFGPANSEDLFVVGPEIDPNWPQDRQ